MKFTSVAKLLGTQWRKPDEPGQELPPREFKISSTSKTFSQYYDEVQERLKSMAGMDELLSGTPSTYTGLYSIGNVEVKPHVSMVKSNPINKCTLVSSAQFLADFSICLKTHAYI